MQLALIIPINVPDNSLPSLGLPPQGSQLPAPVYPTTGPVPTPPDVSATPPIFFPAEPDNSLPPYVAFPLPPHASQQPLPGGGHVSGQPIPGQPPHVSGQPVPGQPPHASTQPLPGGGHVSGQPVPRPPELGGGGKPSHPSTKPPIHIPARPDQGLPPMIAWELPIDLCSPKKPDQTLPPTAQPKK